MYYVRIQLFVEVYLKSKLALLKMNNFSNDFSNDFTSISVDRFFLGILVEEY